MKGNIYDISYILGVEVMKLFLKYFYKKKFDFLLL